MAFTRYNSIFAAAWATLRRQRKATGGVGSAFDSLYSRAVWCLVFLDAAGSTASYHDIC